MIWSCSAQKLSLNLNQIMQTANDLFPNLETKSLKKFSTFMLSIKLDHPLSCVCMYAKARPSVRKHLKSSLSVSLCMLSAFLYQRWEVALGSNWIVVETLKSADIKIAKVSEDFQGVFWQETYIEWTQKSDEHCWGREQAQVKKTDYWQQNLQLKSFF